MNKSYSSIVYRVDVISNKSIHMKTENEFYAIGLIIATNNGMNRKFDVRVKSITR